MNILSITNRHISARFFASLITVSMLISAFPVAFLAAEAANTEATDTAYVSEVTDNETTLECVSGVNLLGNGSFESPIITNEYGWDVFDSLVGGLAWMVDWVTPSAEAPTIPKLELQGGYYSASNGVQYAELDSNWSTAPGTPYAGEDARVKISQSVSTISGQQYELAFDFSALPNSGSDNNAVEIVINGNLIYTESASGIEKTNTDWTRHSYVFTATGSDTEISLADVGTADSFGTLLDNVTLTCLPREMHRISGYKYEVYTESNIPMSGWTMSLEDGEGQVISSAVTDTDGYYYFVVESGYYELHEAIKANWEQVNVLPADNKIETEGEDYCGFDVVDGNELDYRCDFYNKFVGNDEPDEQEDEKEGRNTTGTKVKRPAPQVLGVSTSDACPLIGDHMQMGWNNDPLEVTKLQMFLNSFKDTFGGVENPVTGFFGPVTKSNVKAFQEHYSDEVLFPWFDQGIVPHHNPTGFVYKTSKWKINSIVCPGHDPLPSLEGENLTSNVAVN